MSENDELREEIREAIQEHRTAKAELQELGHELRRNLWDIKKRLDEPTLDDATRAWLEDQAFEHVEALKRNEEAIANTDEGIADLQQSATSLEVVESRSDSAVILGVLIFIVLLIFILWALFR